MNTNKIILGDCEKILDEIDENSIDLIITSPPYADSREKTYGGIHPDNYVQWFLPISKKLLRVLKPSGSFVLNIKEKVVSCERHTYVLDLVLNLKKQLWFWTEEYIWCKKNSFPGKWKNRFRDSWEHCYHFTKSKNFTMNQEAVMIPIGDWSKTRLKNLSENDKTRMNSQVESGFGKNISNWVGKTMVLPTNVLHLPTECGNKNHSAAFPISLPTWFIKLFSNENDIVLDPFAGSGTTLLAAKELNRKYIGIEIKQEYVDIANQRLM
jgi:site-specific DNA-methyltransferase (cytosine-N4-specific)